MVSTNYSTILTESDNTRLRYVAGSHVFQIHGGDHDTSVALSNVLASNMHCNVMTIGQNASTFTGNVGIGTTIPYTTLHVQGASYVSSNMYAVGDVVASRFIGDGSQLTNLPMSTSSGGTAGLANAISMYNPTGTDATGTMYKYVQTNDTTYTNLVVASVTLTTGRWIVTGTVPYKHRNAFVALDTSQWGTFGLYTGTPATFNPTTATTAQFVALPILSTSDFMCQNFTFYVEVTAASASYVLAVTGRGAELQIGGSSRTFMPRAISIAGIGNTSVQDNAAVQAALAVRPVAKSFSVGVATDTFTLTTSGQFTSAASNVQIYCNGLKLIWLDTNNNDYSLQTTTNGVANTTTFTVTTTQTVPVGDVVDIVIDPYLSNQSSLQSGYLYQMINTSPFIHDAANKYITAPSGYMMALGTETPRATLDLDTANVVLSGGLGTASARPSLASAMSNGEIRSIGSATLGGTPNMAANDGFLRISAGGGLNTALRSYMDLSGYSLCNDMNNTVVLGTLGVERMRITSTGSVGINTSSPAQTLDVNGAMRLGTASSGTGTALLRDASGNVIVSASDQRLKTDVRTILGALETVQQMRGVRFRWSSEEEPAFVIPEADRDRDQIGFIAQEVEQVLPEAVCLNGHKDYKTVRYAEIVAVLCEAMKEMKQTYDTRLADLEARIAGLPAGP